MSRRVLGASVFLNGFRRRHDLRDALSQIQEGVALPLGTVLEAWGIDDEGFKSYLAQLQGTSGLEVVVRRVATHPAESTPSPPEPESEPAKASASG